MRIKLLLSGFLFITFLVLTSGFIYKGISLADEKPDKTECPYLQGKVEASCPYLEGKVDNPKSECPYLSDESKCPYNGKNSNKEKETSTRETGKEKKIYHILNNISS